MKLSVAMIVKNEEVLIERALSSVVDADELVVVDTGSTDSTVALAKQFTDAVYTDYAWKDDFAAARNISISRCSGDWILILDADEFVDDGFISTARSLLSEVPHDAVTVDVVAEDKKTSFLQIRLIRPHMRYTGAAHNYIATKNTLHIPLTLYYGHSPAHALDPDRTLRILEASLAANPLPRTMYYYARELFYRKDFIRASWWWEKYVLSSTFTPELADAYLYLARCYWSLGDGEKARGRCMSAIMINPDFREALYFMAELSHPEQGACWDRYASIATSENVLFVRD
jgi:glycosyltransferase involved in cell wall biosynthesis